MDKDTAIDKIKKCLALAKSDNPQFTQALFTVSFVGLVDVIDV